MRTGIYSDNAKNIVTCFRETSRCSSRSIPINSIVQRNSSNTTSPRQACELRRIYKSMIELLLRKYKTDRVCDRFLLISSFASGVIYCIINRSEEHTSEL